MAKKAKRRSKTKLSRRSILTAGAAGAATALLLKVSPVTQGKTFSPELIRPPGALPEDEFLRKCNRCGECMKVCPENALHPATLQGGVAELWTPVLIPRIGYCEYNCTLCGQVCPTGALEELTMEEKHEVKMGTAHFDTTRCLPWAYDTDCIVCEEHCPTPEKAIFAKEEEVVLRDGTTKVFKRPYVDPDLCVGCGICESVCPINDPAAIRVTSGGESRNPDNQFLLEAASPY